MEILQVRGEAYSSCSEKNVNDSDHLRGTPTFSTPWRFVDNKADGRQQVKSRERPVFPLWKKLRMSVDISVELT